MLDIISSICCIRIAIIRLCIKSEVERIYLFDKKMEDEHEYNKTIKQFAIIRDLWQYHFICSKFLYLFYGTRLSCGHCDGNG